jgi:hypothetical protein
LGHGSLGSAVHFELLIDALNSRYDGERPFDVHLHGGSDVYQYRRHFFLRQLAPVS